MRVSNNTSRDADGKMILTKQENGYYCFAHKSRLSKGKGDKLIAEGLAVVVMRKKNGKYAKCYVCEIPQDVPSRSGCCPDCDKLYGEPLQPSKLRSCRKCKQPTVNYFDCSRCQIPAAGVDDTMTYPSNPLSRDLSEESEIPDEELVSPMKHHVVS